MCEMISSIVVASATVIIVLIFRAPLTALLYSFARISDRTKKLSYRGVDIILGSDDQLPVGQQENLQFVALQKTYQSSIITSEETLIMSQLRDAKLAHEQANQVLIYHLAHAHFIIKLLSIDKIIFPEQIQLLLYLNARFRPEPQVSFLPFYEQWRNRNTNITYPFEDFLNFLLRQGLISQDFNGFTITLLGKEYLSTLVRLGGPVLNVINPTPN